MDVSSHLPKKVVGDRMLAIASFTLSFDLLVDTGVCGAFNMVWITSTTVTGSVDQDFTRNSDYARQHVYTTNIY